MPPPHRYMHNNFTYVSSCTKYLIFLLNFIFWLFGKDFFVEIFGRLLIAFSNHKGGLLIGIGLYSFLDKFQATGLIKLDTYYDILLNVSIVLLLAGAIVFIVSFCGCLGKSRQKKFATFTVSHVFNVFTGALRENTCLLKFYSLCLLIFFLCEMAVAIIAFIFPHTMNTVLEDSFTDRVSYARLFEVSIAAFTHIFTSQIITLYRDDPDLQNFIDFVQQEFNCCGLSAGGFLDWSKNEYFNCSSPSVERCGVPYRSVRSILIYFEGKKNRKLVNLKFRTFND